MSSATDANTRGSWPLKTVVSQEITFGRDGNAQKHQAYGWSDPEPQFTWTIGKESALVLDAPAARYGFFLEIDAGYVVAPGQLPWQQLGVRVDGRYVRTVELRHNSPLAIYCPPSAGNGRRFIINFDLPNAFRPSELSDSRDTRELSAAFNRLRILTLVEPIRPQARPVSQLSVFGADAGAILNRAVKLTDVTIDVLLNRFEMLAGMCEMGLVQRILGVEPSSLLCFAEATDRIAIRALDNRFTEVGKDLQPQPDPAEGSEWMIADGVGLFYHAGKSVAEVSAEALLRDERVRIALLRRKLLEDLAARDSKIFVFADPVGVSLENVLPLFLALRRYGPHIMLWADPAAPGSRGAVEEILPGLFRGTFDRSWPPLLGDDIPIGGWLALFVNAWLLASRTGG